MAHRDVLRDVLVAEPKPGRYVRIGASRSRSPRSTSRMAAVPVNVFVIEPIWKSVSASTASGCSTDVTPKPAACSSPSCSRPDGDARRRGLFHRGANGVANPVEGGAHERDANAECRDGPRGDRPRRRGDGSAARRRAACRSSARRRPLALSGGKSPEFAHQTAARLQPDWQGRGLVGRRALRAARRRAAELRHGEAHALRQGRVQPAEVHRIRGEIDPEEASDATALRGRATSG